MSQHRKPMSPELRQSLIDHGLETDTPSQLADSFRNGYRSGHKSALEQIYAALEADPGALWRDQGFQEWRRNRVQD